jgi:hypothetical protein
MRSAFLSSLKLFKLKKAICRINLGLKDLIQPMKGVQGTNVSKNLKIRKTGESISIIYF